MFLFPVISANLPEMFWKCDQSSVFLFYYPYNKMDGYSLNFWLSTPQVTVTPKATSLRES